MLFISFMEGTVEFFLDSKLKSLFKSKSEGEFDRELKIWIEDKDYLQI